MIWQPGKNASRACGVRTHDKPKGEKTMTMYTNVDGDKVCICKPEALAQEKTNRLCDLSMFLAELVY